MKLKKTNLSEKNEKYVFFILLIGLALTYPSVNYLFSEPGFELSCQTGEFLRIRLTTLPPACMACPITCKASVQAYIDENLICNNSVGSMTNSVIVPCNELDNNIGKTVTIKYVVDSNTRHFEKQESVKIEYKK